ncbi:hypothetical protein JWV37_06950 [Sulfurospirillum sp. T05]|uniref:Bro-N domain-containing protein n=1 Tax=Sulfurospirillum tamanense TaxID=2813362 RepID=A0ABS2WS68_9BACT|nr:hypothetical protein [Sulfurospirillum tamanensis]MBN2964512.1 hypothetical protein [Sulfurospirillum tamanensis]
MNLAQSLTRALKHHHTIHFNAALPISIEVLEKVGYGRYRLKVGHKEMTTKSHKELEARARYWGNFTESKEGILTISHLRPKPRVLQSDEHLLEMESFGFLTLLLESKEPSLVLKQWLLNELYHAQSKVFFHTLTSMLLALHEGIVHLPLRIEGRQFLLQWREYKSLNDTLIDFYLAYENLGALRGTLNPMKHTLSLETLFERTALFLSHHTSTLPYAITFSLNDTLEPLWEGTHALLDVRG